MVYMFVYSEAQVSLNYIKLPIKQDGCCSAIFVDGQESFTGRYI